MPVDFELTEDQTLIAQTVEEFATAELRGNMRDYEKLEGVPDSLRKTFLEIGLERVAFPESLGGMAADDRLMALVNEKLGFGDAGAARALLGWEGVVIALQELATGEETSRLLETAVGKGSAPSWGALAYSERASGDGFDGPFATVATRDGDDYRLNGTKSFVGLAEGAALVLVFATVDDGIGIFAVEGDAKGLSVAPCGATTGYMACPTYDVTLDNVSVSAASRLTGGDDTVTGLRRFTTRAALHNAARAVGIMDAAWRYARDYASERVAFGKPIAHFQAIAFMLSDMAMLTDASRWSIWNAAFQFDTHSKTALRDGLSAVAGAYENLRRVTEDAVQILGGAGFVEDHPVEKWMRDAQSLTLHYTTDWICLRGLGLEYTRTTGDAALDELLPLPPIQPVAT
jgi:alkylation response protein AidB-like acyl-CoA dehydrogenase